MKMQVIQFKAFIIVDELTGNVWSRNRWGNPDSMPDLYSTEKKAENQITKGKISLMMRHNNIDPKIYPITVTLN